MRRADTVAIAVGVAVGAIGLAVVQPTADGDPSTASGARTSVLAPSIARLESAVSKLSAPWDTPARETARLRAAQAAVAPDTAAPDSEAGAVASREPVRIPPDPNAEAQKEAPIPEGVQVVETHLDGSMPASFRTAIGRTWGNALAATYARLFMWPLDLRKGLWPGDTLKAVYTVDEERNLTVQAAVLGSQKLGRQLTAFRYPASGDDFASYWTHDGFEVALRLKNSPIESYEQVTSLLRDRPDHKGMDFMAPVGTPVVAPFDARVRRVNWNTRANGLCIELKRSDGVVAKLLHLSDTQVSPGQRVEAGQKIGLSGNTGHSTGPHLHYQLERGASVLDPLDVHETTRRKLPEADREGFEARVAEMDALLESASSE